MRTRLITTSYLLTVVMLFAFTGPLKAQSALDKEIDSLQRLIARSAPDTATVNAYLAIMPRYFSRYMLTGNPKADSLAFFRNTADCRRLSQKLRDPFGEGSSYVWEAYFNNYFGAQSKRDTLLAQAFSIFRSANNKKGLATAHYFKAEMRAGVGTDSARLIAYDSSARFAREAGDVRREAQALRAIGTIHIFQEKFEQAIQELLYVFELQQKTGDNRIHHTTDMLALAYVRNHDHKEALRFAIASIDYCRKFNDTASIVTFYQRLGYLYNDMYSYDKALYFFERALASYKPSNTGIARDVTTSIVSTMAGCLIKQEKYKEASDLIAYCLKKYPAGDEKAVEFFHFIYLDLDYHQGKYRAAEKRLQLLFQHMYDWPFVREYVMRLYTRAGALYIKLNQPDKAALYSDSAYHWALRSNIWGVLMENSLVLYQADSIKGNYADALKHHRLYKAMSDSNQKNIANKQIAELAVQFETDQKNTELASLSNTTLLQKETIQQGKFQRNAVIAGSVLLLLLLLLTYNRYRLKQKANNLLQEKQDEINRQNTVLENMVVEERKITEEKEKLLVEKEWLMKEINHRVKNNLQVVMSLLNTQSSYLKDEAALSAIQESRHRVHAISLIHRKLYQSDRLMTVIDMGTYIKEVIEYLSDNLHVQQRISFGLYIDPISLDVTQAVPMGLIINEAVTNSVKYAFPDNRKGKIDIHLYKTPEGRIELLVSDNGIGLPDNFDWQHTESLGMSLMNGLSRQLDGSFGVEQKNGLTIKINFERSKSTVQ